MGFVPYWYYYEPVKKKFIPNLDTIFEQGPTTFTGPQYTGKSIGLSVLYYMTSMPWKAEDMKNERQSFSIYYDMSTYLPQANLRSRGSIQSPKS